MPKHVNPKRILSACKMSFDGASNTEIAQKIGVTETTVSNWRKLELWKSFEAELVAVVKKQLLNRKN